jgi:starch synthase
MSILFGHPAGSPFSYNAALAHFETGQLEAFCVPWMPSLATLRLIDLIKPLGCKAQRLRRRHFPPLAKAPKIQGRAEELQRLVIRALGWGDDDRLAGQANEWLMRIMVRECRRSSVTAVHAYEDCSLWPFAEARRFGKACIYDMPIGYYPAWEKMEAELARRYADWLPAEGLVSSRYVRPEQKRQEMELADLVLVPSTFAEDTIRAFHPNKCLARAPYGVDLNFWSRGANKPRDETLRFIYAGQLSIRKGIPGLIDAWERATLRDAELRLVGAWKLADSKRASLPPGVRWCPPCSPQALRDHYRDADVFVFPSFFEGFGLVLLEAMACGLPAIASHATAGPDIMTEGSGSLILPDDLESLIENLRWFDKNRDRLREMSRVARAQAERCGWQNYRRRVTEAVAPFV